MFRAGFVCRHKKINIMGQNDGFQFRSFCQMEFMGFAAIVKLYCRQHGYFRPPQTLDNRRFNVLISINLHASFARNLEGTAFSAERGKSDLLLIFRCFLSFAESLRNGYRGFKISEEKYIYYGP
jgi:hypothetical protein